MASFPFGRLGAETSIRKPSKVLLVFFVLFLLLLILSVAFIALYVVEKTKSTDSSSGTGTCSSPACITSAAEILNKLDESINPCDDFYQYSCGGFLKKTHLPDGKINVDSFSVGADFVQYSLREILQNEQLMSNYSKDSAVYKTFTYYMSCMDESSIKNAGIKPILDVIDQHGSWNITNKDWSGDSWILEKILARAFVDLKTTAFIGLGIMASPFNTSEIFITISGGRSGYEDRVLDKEESRSRVPQKHSQNEDFATYYKDKHYKIFMSTIFKLLGSNSTIDEEVNRIVDLEKKFKDVREKFDWRSPKKFKKNIKFMTLNELNNFTSFKFNWTMYFEEILKGTNIIIPSDLKLMILLPDNIKKIVDWIDDKAKSLLANEIIWNVIGGLVNALPVAYREAQDEYIKSIYTTTTPRWKTCNLLTIGAFGYATTLLYVNKHLSEDARKTAAEMFTEIKGQFIAGLVEQTWMDYATRAQAQLKLQKMTDLIGFQSFIKVPATLNSLYKKIRVDQSHLLQNMLNVFKDQILKQINVLRRPIDSSRLTVTSSLDVNAYYSPSTNGMKIQAGILQQPFYKDDGLKALNFGSLGMVVGHEITHGFDNQGSEYDENGNVREWWTKKSRENFVKRSTCLIKQYNKVQIFGYKADGNKTLSENIADNGGLKYAFRAYQKWRDIHGNEDKLPALPFNNDQLFFIGFAQGLCAKYNKKYVKAMLAQRVHSLNPVRVRVPLSNFAEFSKAFGCTPPNNTCPFW